jgi:hypothetical protein
MGGGCGRQAARSVQQPLQVQMSLPIPFRDSAMPKDDFTGELSAAVVRSTQRSTDHQQG